MKHQYQIGGTSYEVHLEPGPEGSTRARIGDHELLFDLRKLSDETALLQREGFRDEIVHFSRERDVLDLHLANRSHRLVAQRVTRRKEGGSTTESELHAPMPGRIVKINVNPGDPVEPGDSLVVLEAMKMEHHIRAGGRATVLSVLVNQGDPVSLGTRLVELDPLEPDTQS